MPNCIRNGEVVASSLRVDPIRKELERVINHVVPAVVVDDVKRIGADQLGLGTSWNVNASTGRMTSA